jgi:hypothetical protein
MKLSSLLTVTAVLEASTGVFLLASPILLASLLLGVLEGAVPLVLARVAGGALLALGIACGCARREPVGPATRGVVAAMLVYNLATAMAFAYGGLVYRLSGVLLWPVVVLHLAMAVWCVACLSRTPRAR